jgi:type I restriction enzyme M protein
MITGELKSQVDKIWEAFWTGGVSNPMSVIEQFTYLLFIRRLDEKELLEEKKANMIGVSAGLDKQSTNKVFAADQQELRWNHFKHLESSMMYDLFTKTTEERPLTVFDHLKSLGKKGGVFTEYMAGATFLIGTPKLLQLVVDMIDKIKMDDRDTKGDLYEYMLSKLASAGTNGQFRTPRHIIKMMVEMTQPQKDDVICDPSCGTAGFLVMAGEYLRDNHEDWFLDAEFRTHFNDKMFNGLENDAAMVKIAAMNMQLHGMENPQLTKTDALSTSNDIAGKYSLILANPPFKGSLDYDDVETSLLKMVKTKKTELLFLGLMLRMLKTGGRCAVIIPDGVLFGSSNAHKQIRQEIIEHHKLDAVISMPSGVFKPYAGVSTAVLFFTKTNSGGTDNVWFYDMKADGYSLDDKRAEIKDNDIPDIIERYKKKELDAERSRSDHSFAFDSAQSAEVKRKRTDASFLVPFSEIKANDWDLSINRYKEIVYEEVEYAAPSELIADIKQLDKDRSEALRMLEELLG